MTWTRTYLCNGNSASNSSNRNGCTTYYGYHRLIALIDGDCVGYRAAASCQPTKAKPFLEPLEAALGRCEDTMQRIKYATKCDLYKVYIGGSDNFRYSINPEYKANRKDLPRPEWLQPVREYLVTVHGASICDGIEADDALGIAQDKLGTVHFGGDIYETVIVSVDKDLLMIPGQHYNFVKDEHSTVDTLQGKQWFYIQLIMGDKADNIFGYDGKARTVVPQFLQPDVNMILSYTDERDMYSHVLDMYQMNGQGKDVMHMNAACLFIQHKENDVWSPPTG